ncbi:nucleotidyl transferase AbiEii/AbiGii toxin family protein [bacterium]|nr:nucleotidyl transferase AbiEii/AbiGii toxin family protein [bacterium]
MRDRLLKQAHALKEDFTLRLTNFGIERFLYRVTQSEFADDFVLKGAVLYTLWDNAPQRPTRDLDLLSLGASDRRRFVELFQGICKAPVEADGVEFDANTVRVARIREDGVHDGLRVTLTGRLGVAVIPVQVDVGFGDRLVPPPRSETLPTMLDHPAPTILAYRPETVIAEKYSATVELGQSNTRMKDFFDIEHFSRTTSFDGGVLGAAIVATFGGRHDDLPRALPIAFTDGFLHDSLKAAQWSAFLRRANLAAREFPDTMKAIRDFLWPLTEAIASGTHADLAREPGGPWRRRS